MSNSDNSITFAKLVPSVVTLFSLCMGLMAIRYSFESNWLYATSFLLIAGLLDGVDGRLARFLNSTSEFGAELDSLADFVNFGVVPGFIIYNWVNEYVDIKIFDWALVMIFSISMAIRLARFNLSLNEKDKDPIIDKYFFQGIPSPVAAAMLMAPMVLTFEYGDGYFFNNPKIVLIYSYIVAFLASSRIPTISIKKIPIKNEYMYFTLFILGLFVVGIFVKPWITLSILCATYIISIFFTIFAYFKINKSK